MAELADWYEAVRRVSDRIGCWRGVKLAWCVRSLATVETRLD